VTSAVIVVAVAAMTALAAWVLLPLVTRASEPLVYDSRAVALLAEREAALREIADLDADLKAERIDVRDHARLRREALERGAAALEGIDRLRRSDTGGNAAAVEWVEQEIRRRLDGGVGRSSIPGWTDASGTAPDRQD